MVGFEHPFRTLAIATLSLLYTTPWSGLGPCFPRQAVRKVQNASVPYSLISLPKEVRGTRVWVQTMHAIQLLGVGRLEWNSLDAPSHSGHREVNAMLFA